MTQLTHALADARHAERYRCASSSARPARDRPRLCSVRRRFGLLLVEAGLHLVTSAEPRRRSARPAA